MNPKNYNKAKNKKDYNKAKLKFGFTDEQMKEHQLDNPLILETKMQIIEKSQEKSESQEESFSKKLYNKSKKLFNKFFNKKELVDQNGVKKLDEIKNLNYYQIKGMSLGLTIDQVKNTNLDNWDESAMNYLFIQFLEHDKPKDVTAEEAFNEFKDLESEQVKLKLNLFYQGAHKYFKETQSSGKSNDKLEILKEGFKISYDLIKGLNKENLYSKRITNEDLEYIKKGLCSTAISSILNPNTPVPKDICDKISSNLDKNDANILSGFSKESSKEFKATTGRIQLTDKKDVTQINQSQQEKARQ